MEKDMEKVLHKAETLIEALPYIQKYNRRIIIARLNDLESATILMDIIAPQIKRDSGYLRIEHAGFRRGDNSEMGTISFVDEIDFEFEAPKEEKPKSKKPATKKEDK